ncbi:quinate permease [Fusarium sp. NRRL 25303]|nr:quinate permease [Fusarium sp. NRRL 25303]
MVQYPFPIPNGSPFPISNIPFGIFHTEDDLDPRPGTAVGDHVLDLRILIQGGLPVDESVKEAVKSTIQEALRDESSILYREDTGIIAADQVIMHVPMKIGGFTDFMCSLEHVQTMGHMAGYSEVPQNFFDLPAAYNGRASSVIVSGQTVTRPHGIIPGPDGATYAPSQKFDFELEMGVFISNPIKYGEPTPASRARDHVFGFVLLNDWSARDIQFYEMSPLGPFNGKATATSISPWIVTLEALEEAGALLTTEILGLRGGKNTTVSFLHCEDDVSVRVSTSLSRNGVTEDLLGKSDLKHLHWSPFQMVAHHSSSGCGLETGDLLGTGTLSSSTEQIEEFGSDHDPIRRSGCLAELVLGGTRPFPLSDGSELVWLEDGDTVTMEGWAGSGDRAIGFAISLTAQQLNMTFKNILRNSPLAGYGKAIREAPREVMFNPHLLLSSLVYAFGGFPVIWDQGASSVIPSLPGFQNHFKIISGSNADEIRVFVSIVYIGFGIGSALTFFINDRIGRLYLIAIFSPSLNVLYAARVIQGLGLGPLTVTCPMAIVEIAPAEIRGLLAAWFTLLMGLGLFTAVFCTLGVYRHVPVGDLQFQIIWLTPMILMSLCMAATFFIQESPRWLFMVQRRQEAINTLVKIRGLPSDGFRVEHEIRVIEDDINRTAEVVGKSSLWTIAKETFTIASNLRRVQQSLVCYALAQLSGANLITSYFVPILAIVGVGGDTTHSMFLSGMYGVSKFFFVFIATFFFIDALGRRKSLFVGASLQMVTHIYLAVYVRTSQSGPVSEAASSAAIAALFIHAFGYGVGLFILPYVFGSELWPNRIRSFGSALSQAFHWLFIYAMQYSMPSILSTFHQWGAFIFFGAWCAVAIVYTYLMIPEISGLSVEEIEDLFRGPWFNAHRRNKQIIVQGVIENGKEDFGDNVDDKREDCDTNEKDIWRVA